MNIKEVIIGIVILLVFWAFQKGYLDSLGTAAWFVGVILFIVLLYLIGMAVMPKPTAEQTQLWMYVSAFALVATFIMAFLAVPLGAVFPANSTPALPTPLVLSLWLVVFGGAFVVGGRMTGRSITMVIGVIWLFSAVHLQLTTGANSYLHFGMITGLSFILEGLMIPAPTAPAAT
jgi:hypothetical protein